MMWAFFKMEYLLQNKVKLVFFLNVINLNEYTISCVVAISLTVEYCKLQDVLCIAVVCFSGFTGSK